MEDVPAAAGTFSSGGVPVYVDFAVRCFGNKGGDGRHAHLPDTDSSSGDVLI